MYNFLLERVLLPIGDKIFGKSLYSSLQKVRKEVLSNEREIKNLQEDIKKYEPKIALDGGNDGLDLIKKIIYKTKNILKFKGKLALEIGNEQNKKVSKILEKNNFKIEHAIKDYKDNVRCVISTYLNN